MTYRMNFFNWMITVALIVPILTVKADVEVNGFANLSLNAEPQEDPVACWAASMSAALKSKGIDLTQDEIKQAVANNTAMATLTNPKQLSAGMDNLLFGNKQFHGTFVSPPLLFSTWDNFKHQIANGNPFLFAYWIAPGAAHCIVVYGAVTNSSGYPTDYKVWDPEPNAGLKTIPVGWLDHRVWFYIAIENAKLSAASSDTSPETPKNDNDTISADITSDNIQTYEQLADSGFSSIRGSQTDFTSDDNGTSTEYSTLSKPFGGANASISKETGTGIVYWLLDAKFYDGTDEDSANTSYQSLNDTMKQKLQGWTSTVKKGGSNSSSYETTTYKSPDGYKVRVSINKRPNEQKYNVRWSMESKVVSTLSVNQ